MPHLNSNSATLSRPLDTPHWKTIAAGTCSQCDAPLSDKGIAFVFPVHRAKFCLHCGNERAALLHIGPAPSMRRKRNKTARR